MKTKKELEETIESLSKRRSILEQEIACAQQELSVLQQGTRAIRLTTFSMYTYGMMMEIARLLPQDLQLVGHRVERFRNREMRIVIESKERRYLVQLDDSGLVEIVVSGQPRGYDAVCSTIYDIVEQVFEEWERS